MSLQNFKIIVLVLAIFVGKVIEHSAISVAGCDPCDTETAIKPTLVKETDIVAQDNFSGQDT